MSQKIKVSVGGLALLGLGLVGGMPLPAAAGPQDLGFFYDEFTLTREVGTRTEAAGPFFYKQQRETESIFAVPPLFSHTEDQTAKAKEFDVLYPFLTYDRFGGEYRWQLMQLLSFAGGQNQQGESRDRFSLFPFYLQQRSTDPTQNYTALFPFYGHLQNRLFRSEIDFVLWPLYVRTKRRPAATEVADDPFLAVPYRFLSARRGDVTTYNFVYPLFHLRYGEGLNGWQFWPLVGRERKEVTTRTNQWGEVDTIPGHEKDFVLWPLFFDLTREIGTENVERQQFLLPFYNYSRSPRRDSTSYGWPLGVTITDDRERGYHEVGAPWPFVVFASGEGKTVRRVWPLFSHGSNTNLESTIYLWPLYKRNRIQSGALDRERTRILLFVASKSEERNTETGATRGRTDLLPLFTHHRDFAGRTRLQILAPLEPIFPTNKSFERNYSPLWSLWRAEQNPQTGAASQSLLWNLYRHESAPGAKKCSLLFGLFQYSSTPDAKKLRVFYIPFGKKHAQPTKPTE